MKEFVFGCGQPLVCFCLLMAVFIILALTMAIVAANKKRAAGKPEQGFLSAAPMAAFLTIGGFAVLRFFGLGACN